MHKIAADIKILHAFGLVLLVVLSFTIINNIEYMKEGSTADGKLHYEWKTPGLCVVEYNGTKYPISELELAGAVHKIKWIWGENSSLLVKFDDKVYTINSPSYKHAYNFKNIPKDLVIGSLLYYCIFILLKGRKR